MAELSRRTAGKLGKSAIGNYESGERGIGYKEAMALADALNESPAHILCLEDENMPALSKSEAQLINDLRALPEDQRAMYAERISALAKVYKATPITDAAVRRTAYDPSKRPPGATPKKRQPGKHDN